MSQKYLVFNIKELRTLLPPEQVEYLEKLTTFIDLERAKHAEESWERARSAENEKAAKEQRPPNEVPRPSTEPPLYWVLNMKDEFALGSLEHYLSLIDDSEFRNDSNVRATAQAARIVRNRAKFIETKLPD